MKRHIFCVHDKKKPFHCDICQANFGLNGDLKRHISRIHDNPKLYSCSICNEEFLKRNLLNNHVSSIHEGKILFNCKLCNAKFANKSHLSRHTSNVHKEKCQDKQKVKEALEIKTENFQVELKGEAPAVQIKTEITESVENEDFIFGV